MPEIDRSVKVDLLRSEFELLKLLRCLDWPYLRLAAERAHLADTMARLPLESCHFGRLAPVAFGTATNQLLLRLRRTK